jgi:hypothetical protein
MKVRLSIATAAAAAAALSLTLSAGAANRPGDYTVHPNPDKWGVVRPNPLGMRGRGMAARPHASAGWNRGMTARAHQATWNRTAS